ncbi:MAG: nucleotidyltransferase family protein [Gemmatimonadaceae bacterium]|nr:nucleotidyltransferase family protein [Gemmatimonadaceae bacterium]
MLAPLTSASAIALLSPSARVLAAAAAPDSGVSEVATLPWRDVQWQTLLEMATFERAESQLHRLLAAAPPGVVPDEVARAVQGLYRVAVFHAAELADAAGAAHDALAAARVPALWLKGAALAMQAEEEFSLRGMGDLDVLVAPEHHPRARAVLREAGWVEPPEPVGYAEHHHEAPMSWRGQARLELHGGLFPPRHPFAADPAELWLARGVEAVWGARLVRVLPAHWHLVHAAVHWAWSHEGEIGTWQLLHDMHELGSGPVADAQFWSDVVEAASNIDAGIPTGWALWSAALLGRVPVPAEAWRRLRGVPSMVGMTERQWVVRAFQSPAASPSVKWTRFWWRRAMRNLGAPGGRWPWAAGRAGVIPVPDRSRAALLSRGGSGTGRWRDHLGRVLRG